MNYYKLPLTHVGSIVTAAFADVHHRMPFAQESAGHDLADDQLVVTR